MLKANDESYHMAYVFTTSHYFPEPGHVTIHINMFLKTNSTKSPNFFGQIISISMINKCEVKLFQIPITIEFNKPKSTTSYHFMINDNDYDILKLNN